MTFAAAIAAGVVFAALFLAGWCMWWTAYLNGEDDQ